MGLIPTGRLALLPFYVTEIQRNLSLESKARQKHSDARLGTRDQRAGLADFQSEYARYSNGDE